MPSKRNYNWLIPVATIATAIASIATTLIKTDDNQTSISASYQVLKDYAESTQKEMAELKIKIAYIEGRIVSIHASHPSTARFLATESIEPEKIIEFSKLPNNIDAARLSVEQNGTQTPVSN